MTERRRNLLARIADPLTPEVLRQRLGTGESLREVADSWEVAYTKLVSWIAQQGDLSEDLRRAREIAGHEYRMEGLEIIDEATAETLLVAKERAQYRERLSKAFTPKVYGDKAGVSVAGDAKITIIHQSE